MRFRVIQLGSFAALLSCGGGGGEGTTGPSPAAGPAPVASLTLTATAPTVNVGKSVKVTAEAKDASGNVLIGRATAWSSSDVSLAGISTDGVVIGVAVGNVTISATSEGKLGTIALKVLPPPAPNPDSSLAGRIVYVLVESGAARLHIYTVATRSDVSLGVAGVNPKFSPDGKLIVFQTPAGITVMNSDGSGQRTVSSFGGVPSFDPTGTIVAFGHRDTGVWKVNADGTALTQITNDAGFQPAWSPDGSRIAYSGVGTVAGGLGLQLFIVNADGTNRHQALTSKKIVDVVWRPSGKILFGLDVNDDPLNYEIHSYDPSKATSPARLTTRSENDFEPSWSPDGQHISWSTVEDGLWIMNADGTNQHLVIAKARQGSWGK